MTKKPPFYAPMRDISSTARLMGLIREYASLPDPNAFTPEEVGNIWLACACLEYCYSHDMPLYMQDFDRLSDYLADNWRFMPDYLKRAIPYDAVDVGGAEGIGILSWKDRHNCMIMKVCCDYVSLMEKRYAVEDVQGDKSSNSSVPEGVVVH